MIDWPKTGTPGHHWVEYDVDGNLLRSGYETPAKSANVETLHQPVSMEQFELVVRGNHYDKPHSITQHLDEYYARPYALTKKLVIEP